MRRAMILALLIVAFLGRPVACAEAETPFTVEALGMPSRLVLGLQATIVLRARCVAGQPIASDVWRESLHLRIIGPDGRLLRWSCEPLLSEQISSATPGPRLPGSELQRVVWFCPRAPGRYTIEAMLTTGKGIATRYEGPLPVWEGVARSEQMLVDVVPPEGTDLKAFSSYDGDPLRIFTRGRDPARYGELLRRFPLSSYAAWVVWRRSSRVLARTDIPSSINHMQSESRLGNDVPCDDEQRCDDNGWMTLNADELVGWRDRWFVKVIEQHPELWFVDDIRFTLALDRYLLGDRQACVRGLEELASRGEPAVAKKMQQLLEEMRSQGMLEPPPQSSEPDADPAGTSDQGHDPSSGCSTS